MICYRGRREMGRRRVEQKVRSFEVQLPPSRLFHHPSQDPLELMD